MNYQVIFYRWNQQPHPGRVAHKSLESFQMHEVDDPEKGRKNIEFHRLDLTARGWTPVIDKPHKLEVKKDSENVYGEKVEVHCLYQMVVEYDEQDYFDEDQIVFIRDIFGETLARLKGDVKLNAIQGNDSTANEELDIINKCQHMEGCPEFKDVGQFFRCKSGSWAEIIDDGEEDDED